jgi:hypothetical protein
MVKLIQEKVGNALNYRGTDNNFMNRILIAQQLRERVGRWDCMKLKSFCPVKRKWSPD